MKNVYDIHLHIDGYTDEPRWLCRECARKRQARRQPQYCVGGTEVCEECGCKQAAFEIGSFVERKRASGRSKVGRVVGAGYGGHLQVDWMAPHRIGGDGWHRSALSFKAVKPASPELAEKAAQYAARRD